MADGGKKKLLPIVGAPGEAPKRRLPMLAQAEVADASDEERPPWHWSAIGAAAIFLAWLPLAYVVNGPLGGLFNGGLAAKIAAVALNLGAFLVAGFGGGYLIGRFGGKAGVKEATVGGVAAAAFAWALAAAQARSGLLVWLMLLVGMAMLGGGAARVGGRFGVHARKP
jgi:tRNA-(ms[2]io[6]A)-hydroxylase